MLHTGHSNPFFKIATVQDEPVDWVILGASHAMPLDFADFNAQMESETRLRILNLAAPGAGPLYNRFVLRALPARASHAQPALCRGFIRVLLAHLERGSLRRRQAAQAHAVRPGHRPAPLGLRPPRRRGCPRALLDYVSGFSKINNRERFQRDVWEGEAQFERVYRPSASAGEKAHRLPVSGQDLGGSAGRYLEAFSALIALARQARRATWS